MVLIGFVSSVDGFSLRMTSFIIFDGGTGVLYFFKALRDTNSLEVVALSSSSTSDDAAAMEGTNLKPNPSLMSLSMATLLTTTAREVFFFFTRTTKIRLMLSIHHTMEPGLK